MIKVNNVDELNKVVAIPDEAVKFLKEINQDTPCGKYYFGDTCYINLMNCDTHEIKFNDDNAAIMEAHNEYIDAQFLVSGEEKMLYGSRENMPVHKEYNPEKDVLFYCVKPYREICYKAGEAIVLPPEDAHQPNCCVNEPMTLKKAVVKIKA